MSLFLVEKKAVRREIRGEKKRRNESRSSVGERLIDETNYFLLGTRVLLWHRDSFWFQNCVGNEERRAVGRRRDSNRDDDVFRLRRGALHRVGRHGGIAGNGGGAHRHSQRLHQGSGRAAGHSQKVSFITLINVSAMERLCRVFGVYEYRDAEILVSVLMSCTMSFSILGISRVLGWCINKFCVFWIKLI